MGTSTQRKAAWCRHLIGPADTVAASGMERGVAASYDRLDELLLSMPAPETQQT
jgi:hypothetical protein